MATMKNVADKICEMIYSRDRRQPEPYDTTAEVRRVENGKAYVHLPGGVDETPVALTIDAAAGDMVQVRVANGAAWLVGNRTAPPTDDTTARSAQSTATKADKAATEAQATAEEAQETADKIRQNFWTDDDGAHITEVTQAEYEADPETAGGNLLARSDGMAIREGTKELATMTKDGFDAKTYDSSDNEVVIAHLGYGAGTNDSGGTSNAPYYDIGVRLSGSTKGNYSTVEGYDNTASGYGSHAEGGVNIASGTNSHCEGARNTASGHYSHCEGALNTASGVDSHCEGYGSEASGTFSHAGGYGTIADQPHQTAIGKFNTVNNTNNLFVVGNGTSGNARSNAFEVTETGDVTAAGQIIGATDTITPTITASTGTLVAAKLYINGKTAQLVFTFRKTTATAQGSNIFAGTLTNAAYRPINTATGATFYGNNALIGVITDAGTITVRNTGASITITSSNQAIISFTYILA